MDESTQSLLDAEMALERYYGGTAEDNEELPDATESETQEQDVDDAQPVEESEETEIQPAEPVEEKIKVIINGEEREVTKSDLIERYQLETAADEKFRKAAELRKEIDNDKSVYTNKLDALQTTLDSFTQLVNQWQQVGGLNPPDPALLDSDPVKYLKEQALYQERSAQIQNAVNAQEYINQTRERERLASLNDHIKAELEKIPAVLPEWKDSNLQKKEQAELVNYLKQLNYSDSDITDLSYSSASNIAIAVKAMRYDALKANAAKEQKPMLAKVNKPSPAKQVGSSARERFNKTLSVDDAADAIAELFSR